MANRAPVKRGNYCVAGRVKTLVVPIRFILQESLCIDFPPTKNYRFLIYCFLVLFDSLESFISLSNATLLTLTLHLNRTTVKLN